MPERRWRRDLIWAWATPPFFLVALLWWHPEPGMVMSFFAFLIGAAVEIPNLRESPGQQTDSGILSIVSLSGFVVCEALARTMAWLPHWMIEFTPARSLVGLFLLVAAVTLRGQARRELAGAFRYSLHVADGQNLVTTGIYAHCRHPAYLGAHLFLAAVPLAGGSILGVLASVAAIPSSLARIRREETLLESAYGEAFREWKRRVPSRLAPW